MPVAARWVARSHALRRVTAPRAAGRDRHAVGRESAAAGLGQHLTAQPLQRRERASLVLADESRVADKVGGATRGETALPRGLSRWSGAPAALVPSVSRSAAIGQRGPPRLS
jgi:hypothetical protein